MLRRHLNSFSLSAQSHGYSLVELLVAASLSVIVVGATGFGLQASLQANQKASANSTTLGRLNQVNEFMSDEIRAAIKVELDAAYAIDNKSPSFQANLPLPKNQIVPVLALQMPGVFQRIIYYVGQPSSDRLGPKVLYRWGPMFDGSGDYKADQVENPNVWTHTPLADLLATAVIANPGCPSSDWQANPPVNAPGFYTCVNSTNARLVELNMTASVTRVTGSPITKSMKTMVFVRSEEKEGGGGNTPKFSISGKKLTLDEPANVRFEVLGGSITCGAGGQNVPVTTKLFLNDNSTAETWDASQPLMKPALPKGTSVEVESQAKGPTASGSCASHDLKANSTTNSPLLQVLVDGDPVPDITPFDNQATIDTFLRNYIQDGKIKLANNQAIYLFELGTTDSNSTAFDLQDNVVLATIESPY